ncbi:MAG: sigma-70 family polymerase sigma factor [Chitinophagaceae bacterium]|nr:sigma-70 family polymerase sigma factor [Chitinophagaceae bacterium]
MEKNQPEHITDQQLLEKYYQSHDTNLLGILLQRYTMLLLGVSMKYLKNEEEAKDSVQQIFLKVINELPKVKVTFFKSWLYMVAKNHCLMKLRERHIHVSGEVTDNLRIAEDDVNSQEKQEEEKLLSLVTESLPELKTEQESCVRLFYLEKKSYQEITKITGYSVLQVKSHIQNGKRNLRMIIEKKLKNNG